MAKDDPMFSFEIPSGIAADFPEPKSSYGNGWELICGDSIEALAAREPDSIDYSVFSPPFASLYIYSDDERDMGNCLTTEEFFEHFDYLIPLLLKVTKPGRNLSFHCMNLPSIKERDGVIGLKDFRGQLIAAFEKHGWIFHSEVCIWKDPVTAMQRTKAIGLLYKQLRKDSTLSRQGIADYFVTMRKRGENPERVTKTHAGFPVDLWQKWASPVWMDIDPGDTLQYTHGTVPAELSTAGSAREGSGGGGDAGHA